MALQNWALRAKSLTLSVVSFLCLLFSLQYVTTSLLLQPLRISHFHIYRPRWTLLLLSGTIRLGKRFLLQGALTMVLSRQQEINQHSLYTGKTSNKSVRKKLRCKTSHKKLLRQLLKFFQNKQREPRQKNLKKCLKQSPIE